MCDKYTIHRLKKCYEATNKVTCRIYRRFVSQPRQWYENHEPVDNLALVNTLEGAVCDYNAALTQHKPPRQTFRAAIRPMPRAPIVPGPRGRGEGNRYE